MPAPPADEGGGCGILGKIIMIVVAVAVTAVTGGAGGAVSSFWGGLLGQGSAAAAVATGATAAAAGSVASQAVGVAIGAQSKFSWKNVALAAVSGGVSGGLGTVDFTGSGELGSLGNTVIRSALGNTISQGIGVATGLQKSFDWKSVAGAAVGAGVGWGVGQALGSNANTLAGASLRSFAAGAATALVRGGKISIAQVAVDAFGQAMGDGLGDALRVGLGQSNAPQFMGGGAGGGGADGGYSSFDADTSNFGPSAQEAFRASEIAAQNQGAGAWDAMDGYAGAIPGDSSSLYGLGTPGSLGGLGLQARGGLGLSAAGLRATGDELVLGGLDDRNGMDVQSDQYDARYRTATVQKNQGPLAALADLGLDAQQQRAGYGYLLATGQVELDRNGVPMVQPGQQLTIDLSDNRYGNTAGQAIAQESGLRAQREQQLAAQQAAETAHTAQENQESWDQMRMAWGGRTGTQGPVWHLGGSAQATATQTGGRNIDVMSMDPLGNPTGGMQQEWVSDQPGSSYAQAMGNVARSVGNFVDGATQLAVNGTITGMVVRPASSLMALPAAVFMGPEAYTAIQADLQERWSPESNNPGAIAIQQSLGQMLQPVGQTLGELRTASENRFGDGATTAGFAIAQGALEVGGFVSGVSAIPGGRAALGSLGGSIQGGFNTLADAMPVGSGAGGLRAPALQWGAVGDLEGVGVGNRVMLGESRFQMGPNDGPPIAIDLLRSRQQLAISGDINLKTFDFGSHLRATAGDPPLGMPDPHAHHILFKQGLGAEQQSLVIEGQALLRKYEIDPILGQENLIWAPNRIKGQHDINALRNVIDNLKMTDEMFGRREDMIDALRNLGRTAAERR
ncbi:hypothetical protein ACN9MJ_13060 [Acidovorax facilis]|uniref:hypothetical protein n=1 Tax=Acidovorax facilis TaxID=12917 RepID=UPI003CFB0759